MNICIDYGTCLKEMLDFSHCIFQSELGRMLSHCPPLTLRDATTKQTTAQYSKYKMALYDGQQHDRSTALASV